VLVTSERLAVAGRTWLLGEVQQVEVVRRAPRVLPILVTLGGGVVVGLPALLASMAAPGARGEGLFELALVVAALVIFGSITRLFSIADTYWLMVRTPQGERRVFRTRQHQLVSSLASVVSQAAAARRRH
jgi:hypothetical protein